VVLGALSMATRIDISATTVLALAGIGLAGFVTWRVYRAGSNLVEGTAELATDVVTEYLNPVHSGNVINRGFTSLGSWATGNPHFSLGSSIYDWTHTDPNEPTKNTLVEAFNPVDEDNLANRAVNGIGRWATGEKGWTLGSAIYDFFNPPPKG
jgi:hypothetical protein